MIRSIVVDALSIIPLLFTITLARRHIIQNRKNIYYIIAAVITITLLVLETESILLAQPNDPSLIVLNRLVNILGFSLSPTIPYVILFFIRDKEKIKVQKKLLALPLCLNALICILSYQTGWVFFVDAQNQYVRGSLFLFPTLVSMFYYTLNIIEIFQYRAEYKKEDIKIVIYIFLLPVAAILLQIIYPEALLIWGSVSITLLLYFIFSLELQFDYDIQTGVRNRTAFEKEMLQNDDKKTDATVFVFDINNLKGTNDVFGHKAGDDLIQISVNTIKACFSESGQTYRIGGDEFCIICREMPPRAAEKLLSNFDRLLRRVNETRSNKIEIAYGYSSCKYKKKESIYTAFSRADNAMYAHKAKSKGIEAVPNLTE